MGCPRLDLSHNQLEAIPPSIACLTSLQVLDLRGNPSLTNLPKELGSLDHLMCLDYDEVCMAVSNFNYFFFFIYHYYILI